MLEQRFETVYTKFKLHFYQEIFERFQNREASLTTVETFCMEIIMALGQPTVNEFSNFVGISPPNAAYKINNLIQKGYVRKERSPEDKREYHLVVTQKYIDYYNISYSYLGTVMGRIQQRFGRVVRLKHIPLRTGPTQRQGGAGRQTGGGISNPHRLAVLL